jgi:hypothetical protein
VNIVPRAVGDTVTEDRSFDEPKGLPGSLVVA